MESPQRSRPWAGAADLGYICWSSPLLKDGPYGTDGKLLHVEAVLELWPVGNLLRISSGSLEPHRRGFMWSRDRGQLWRDGRVKEL